MKNLNEDFIKTLLKATLASRDAALRLELPADTTLHELAESTAIRILSEIQAALSEYKENDFLCVEEIVCIMEKYDFHCGGCHDFG